VIFVLYAHWWLVSFAEVVAASASRPEHWVSADGSLNNAGVAGGFSVIVDRSSGERLGIEVETFDGRALMLSVVESQGLVPSWNETVPPSLHVKPGQIILEVNDVRGDSTEMLSECRKQKLLRFWIMHPSAGVC